MNITRLIGKAILWFTFSWKSLYCLSFLWADLAQLRIKCRGCDRNWWLTIHSANYSGAPFLLFLSYYPTLIYIFFLVRFSIVIYFFIVQIMPDLNVGKLIPGDGLTPPYFGPTSMGGGTAVDTSMTSNSTIIHCVVPTKSWCFYQQDIQLYNHPLRRAH